MIPRVLAASLAAALLLTGCTLGGGGGDGTTTTTTSTTTVATTPEPTTTTPPTNTTSTPPTPTTTTPVPPTNTTPPPLNMTIRHDYSAAPENVTFVIPASATNVNLTINFDVGPTPAGAYACIGQLRLVVTRPDGSVHKDVLAQPQTSQTADAHCGMISTGTFPTDVPAGEWHVGFEGQGVGFGWVRVQSA